MSREQHQAPNQRSGSTAPAWKNLTGMKRVQAEFKHMTKLIEGGQLGGIRDLTIVDDNLLTWQMKLSNFDNDLKGGKNLNKDLHKLKCQYGQDHLLMEINFPKDYPHQPFFIRVVSPRCRMYTGHVTAGGSICLESLTNSGTEGSWQPDFSVESLINVIIINMIDCQEVFVQTATGPGGMSGPLRVDFSYPNPCRGYSAAEARSAFTRTLENHKRTGWGAVPPAAAAAAAAGQSSAAAAAAAGPSSLAALPARRAQPPRHARAAGSPQQPHPMRAGKAQAAAAPAAVLPAAPAAPPALPAAAAAALPAPAAKRARSSAADIIALLSDDEEDTAMSPSQSSRRKKRRPGTQTLAADRSSAAAAAAGRSAVAAVRLAAAAAAAVAGHSAAAASGRKRRSVDIVDLMDDDDGDVAIVHEQRGAAAAAAGPPAAAAAAAPPLLPPPDKILLEVQYPTHWDLTMMQDRSGPPVLIDLPLSDRHLTRATSHAPTLSPLEEAAQSLHIADTAVAQLQQQGLERDDALAALVLAKGNADDALLVAINCMEAGGAAKVWGESAGSCKAARRQARKQREQREAERVARVCKVWEEAAGVLKKLEENGISRGRVIKLERLQHGKLWRKYHLFREGLQEEAGAAGINERQLFHGAAAEVIDAIAKDGFDMRLANVNCAYGQGTYFADHSSMAFSYCSKGMPATAMVGTAAAGAAPAAAGYPGMLPPVTWRAFAGARYPPPGLVAPYQPPPGQGQGTTYKMVLARVALGRQCGGQAGMRRPPAGFDSVTGSGCHVVFDNAQAYPEYIITIR